MPGWFRTSLFATGHALMFAAGLFGTCFLGWLGYVAAGGWSETGLGFGWLWFAMLPYLVAWVVLTFRSLPIALLVAGLSPLVMIGPWMVGLVVGVFTFFLFGAPGFLVAGAVTAALLLTAQELDGPVHWPAWVKVHLIGLVPGALCLAWGFFQTGNKSFRPDRFIGAVAWLAFALALHAAASWVRLDAEGRARVSPLRVIVLLVGALLASGVAYARQGPDRSVLAWAWEFQRDKVFRVRHGDRLLYPGETVPLELGDGGLLLTVPKGWRASVLHWPATSVTLRPEVRPDVGVTSIKLSGFVSQEWVVRPDQYDTSIPEHRRREFGCTSGPLAPDGLALCRDVIKPTRQVADALPSDVLQFNVAPGPGLQGTGHYSYFAFGRLVRAACSPGGGCTMDMPLAPGGEVSVAFPEGDLQRWREVRTAAEDLLRAAAGVSLATYPPFPP